MKKFFNILDDQCKGSGRRTVTKKEEGKKQVTKRTVLGCVCTATFDLHPGNPDRLKVLLLADVYVYDGVSRVPQLHFWTGKLR